MFPISTRASRSAVSPSHLKCFTGETEPRNSATASIPFNSCAAGELQAPRELLWLVWGSSEKTEQMEKHPSYQISRDWQAAGGGHQDQTRGSVSSLVPLAQGCCEGRGSGTTGRAWLGLAGGPAANGRGAGLGQLPGTGEHRGGRGSSPLPPAPHCFRFVKKQQSAWSS